MPNRILKESVCTSDNVDKLSSFQETFFYRLIVNCDDFGRMDARPQILASKLFPLKSVRIAHVTDALRALTSAELIVLYEKDGHPFLQMKTWDRHQTIRAKKSKYPSPDDDCNQLQADEINCKQMNTNDSKCSRNPIQSVSVSVSNPYPTRTRAKGVPDDPAFAAFWDEYPRKMSKQRAISEWKKLNPSQELITMIMESLAKWTKSNQWTKNGGQFIPYPSTWLHERRWEDEIPQEIHEKAPVKTVPAQQYDQRDYSGEQEDARDRMIRQYRQEAGS